LFCQLQYLFGLYLREHPPLLHCHLAEEIAALKCSKTDRSDRSAKDLFCEFFRLVNIYLMDELMTALLPQCPKPKPGCGVVLGTAEVRAGKIVRLCNTPRQYVWTLRNALPLLFLWAVTNAVTDREVDSECCFDYKFRCDLLENAFAVEEPDVRKWVRAPYAAARQVTTDFSAQFDMARTDWAPTSLLEHTTRQRLSAVMERFSLHRVERTPEELEMAAILRPLTLRRDSQIAVTEKTEERVSAAPVPTSVDTARIDAMQHELSQKEQMLKELQEKLKVQEAANAEHMKHFEQLDKAVQELRDRPNTNPNPS